MKLVRVLPLALLSLTAAADRFGCCKYPPVGEEFDPRRGADLAAVRELLSA